MDSREPHPQDNFRCRDTFLSNMLHDMFDMKLSLQKPRGADIFFHNYSRIMFISMFASGGLSTRSPALSAAHPTSAPRSDRERRGRERKEVTKEEEEESPSGGRTCGEKAVLLRQELMKYQGKAQFPTNIIYKKHHGATVVFSFYCCRQDFQLTISSIN